MEKKMSGVDLNICSWTRNFLIKIITHSWEVRGRITSRNSKYQNLCELFIKDIKPRAQLKKYLKFLNEQQQFSK